MKKILILVPDLKLTGGVANYYRFLDLKELDNIDYFNINGGYFNNVFLRLIERYISFLLIVFKYDLVHVNPSLLRKSYLRDSIFIILAKLLNRKVIVFIRGWDLSFEDNIKTNKIYRFIFNRIWKRVDKFLVLGKTFQDKLIKMGIESSISIETTLSTYQNANEKKLEKTIYLLFISRLVKEKGIYIAIDTIEILIKKYKINNIILNIAGDGKIFAEVQSYINKKNMNNINLLGNVTGKEKDELYKKSHIMLFPTYFGEGLPNSILEGMGSGLPIISRINAGIPDQVIDNENGFLTDSKDPEWFAKKIYFLLENKDIYCRISSNNINKSEYYSIKSIKGRLLNYYEEI